jgi:hypothetical protein
VIKDDHMSADIEPKREPWRVYTAIVALLLPMIYAASWGPVGSLAANSAALGEMADTAYAPMAWLESSTPLSRPLGWYWGLFAAWRPAEPLPSIRGIDDDLQYFPPGPEFKLTRQVQVIEEYNRRKEGQAAATDPSSTDEKTIIRVDHQETKTERSGAEK